MNVKKIRKYSGVVEVCFEINPPFLVTNSADDKTAYAVLVTNLNNLNYTTIVNNNNVNDHIFPRYINRLEFSPTSGKKCTPCEPNLFPELKNLTNSFLDQSWKRGMISGNSPITVKLAIDSSHQDYPEDNSGKIFLHILRRKTSYEKNSLAFLSHEIAIGGGFFKFHNNTQKENVSKCFLAVDFGNNTTVANISFDSSNDRDMVLVKRSSIVALKGPVNLDKFTKPRLCVGKISSDNKDHYSRNYIPVWTGSFGEKGLQLFSANCFTLAHKFPKRALCHPDSYSDLNTGDTKNIQDSSLEIMYVSSAPDNQVSSSFFLPKRLPAELFLFDFLERISAVEVPGQDERVGTPLHIVVTYPTTYMIDEILKLQKSFIRSYLRRLDIIPDNQGTINRVDLVDQQNNPGILKTKVSLAIEELKAMEELKIEISDKSIISGMLDEASAAAYFYIKKILLSDYGLKGFRLLHPEGCRVVIVDCGAGTTDVASFDLTLEEKNSSLAMHVVLSKLTGDQIFCGDYITKQIAMLIKAHILNEVRNLKPATRNSVNNNNMVINSPRSNDPEEFIKECYAFLENNKSNFNNFPGIDCQFNLGDNVSVKAKFLTALIEEAERIKVLISKIDPPPKVVKLSDAIINTIPKDLSDLQESCKKIEIKPEQIDKLIDKQLSQLCDSINNSILIPSKEDSSCSKIVHEVVLTGKGGLYPYIIKKFQEKLSLVEPTLQITSLKDKFKEKLPNLTKNESQDFLKNCVSIGARMWLEDSMSTSAEVIFKNKLIEELPFDVFVDDPSTNSKRLIYKVQTKYNEMTMDSTNIDSDPIIDSNQSGVNDFTIYRRYPGNINYEQFMKFSWDKPAKNIKIFWDKKKMSFIANSENQGSPKSSIRIDNNGEDYFDSPLWSGKI